MSTVETLEPEPASVFDPLAGMWVSSRNRCPFLGDFERIHGLFMTLWLQQPFSVLAFLESACELKLHSFTIWGGFPWEAVDAKGLKIDVS